MNETIDLASAASQFRDTLVPRADAHAAGVYPLWHGWALFDAFTAGAKWQASQTDIAPELLAKILNERLLATVPWHERLDLLAIVRNGFCDQCGYDDPDGRCQCWNDE